VQICPKCQLINPDSALRCDCGYDFPSGTIQKAFLADGAERSTHRKRPTWVTAVALFNFALLGALLLPRLPRFNASVILALQLWALGSTLFATVFFVWRRTKETRLRYNGNPMTFDGMFLAAWWTVLVLLILTAFGMGLAGI
jgi:hypothetical protein